MEEKSQADLIYQKQENNIKEDEKLRNECRRHLDSHFLEHISSVPDHQGIVNSDMMREWYKNYEACSNFTFEFWTDIPFSYPTLGGRISYESRSQRFNWKLSK